MASGFVIEAVVASVFHMLLNPRALPTVNLEPNAQTRATPIAPHNFPIYDGPCTPPGLDLQPRPPSQAASKTLLPGELSHLRLHGPNAKHLWKLCGKIRLLNGNSRHFQAVAKARDEDMAVARTGHDLWTGLRCVLSKLTTTHRGDLARSQ